MSGHGPEHELDLDGDYDTGHGSVFIAGRVALTALAVAVVLAVLGALVRPEAMMRLLRLVTQGTRMMGGV